MEQTQQSKTKYWLWFFIWFTIMVTMLVMPSLRPFFWLALPGVCTYFALGMDLI